MIQCSFQNEINTLEHNNIDTQSGRVSEFNVRMRTCALIYEHKQKSWK